MDRKKLPKSKKSLKNMTREQLQEALQKKKEGNAKAQEIVESFIDSVQLESVFLSKLFDINQSHYQDIVEERVILKRCGYPLCVSQLENIPKKQYHISTVHNRVFDITERKNFCSNECFKSSNFIKDQLLTSPLWMRDTEKCPEFKLLPRSISLTGITGDEVDLGHNRIKSTEIEKPLDTIESFVNEQIPNLSKDSKINETIRDLSKINNFSTSKNARCDQNEKIVNDNQGIELGTVKVSEKNVSTGSHESTDSSSCTNCSNVKENSNLNVKTKDRNDGIDIQTKEPSEEKKSTDKQTSNIHVSGDVMFTRSSMNEDTINDIDKENWKVSNEITRKHRESSKIDTAIVVESSVDQSKNQTNELLENNKTIVKDICEQTIVENKVVNKEIEKKSENSETKKQTKSVCKKNAQIEEKTNVINKIIILESCIKQWITIDTLVYLLGEGTVQTILKEKNKEFQRIDRNQLGNVSSNEAYDKYLSICKKLNMMELLDEQEDMKFRKPKPEKPIPHFEQLKKQTEQMMIHVQEFYKGDKRKVTFAEEIEDTKEEGQEPVILPAVDLHAQNALRRKILMDKLNRIVPDVLRMLRVPHLSLSSDLRNLIRTFKLTAHNIMFQTSEWSLIAVILLKLLAMKDVYLKEVFDSELSKKQLILVSMSYSLDPGYIDRLLTWLLEPDYIISAS